MRHVQEFTYMYIHVLVHVPLQTTHTQTCTRIYTRSTHYSLTMFLTSLKPVALQWTTLALGSNLCTELTANATLVLCCSLPGTKFLALWHSSKMRQPSKSSPPHLLEMTSRLPTYVYTCVSQHRPQEFIPIHSYWSLWLCAHMCNVMLYTSLHCTY